MACAGCLRRREMLLAFIGRLIRMRIHPDVPAPGEAHLLTITEEHRYEAAPGVDSDIPVKDCETWL